MLVNSLHVFFFERDHLLLLALMLDFLCPLPLDLQHLALLRIIHSPIMEIQQLLCLLHHDLEERNCAHFKVAFHFINLHERKYQALGTCHTLHSKEALVQA